MKETMSLGCERGNTDEYAACVVFRYGIVIILDRSKTSKIGENMVVISTKLAIVSAGESIGESFGTGSGAGGYVSAATGMSTSAETNANVRAVCLGL